MAFFQLFTVRVATSVTVELCRSIGSNASVQSREIGSNLPEGGSLVVFVLVPAAVVSFAWGIVHLLVASPVPLTTGVSAGGSGSTMRWQG